MRVANLDVVNLRPGARLDLCVDLGRFFVGARSLKPGESFGVPMGFPYKLDEHGLQGIPSKLPDRDLQLLVDDTRALLRDFIDSRDIPEMTVAGDRLAASYSFKNLVTTPLVSSDGRIVRMVAGPLREVWIFSLLEHAAKCRTLRFQIGDLDLTKRLEAAEVHGAPSLCQI